MEGFRVTIMFPGTVISETVFALAESSTTIAKVPFGAIAIVPPLTSTELETVGLVPPVTMYVRLSVAM